MSAVAPAEAERAWKRAIEEHAAAMLRTMFNEAGRDSPIALGDDSGGLVVDVLGPDGQWRSFYVRLTEVVK